MGVHIHVNVHVHGLPHIIVSALWLDGPAGALSNCLFRHLVSEVQSKKANQKFAA